MELELNLTFTGAEPLGKGPMKIDYYVIDAFTDKCFSGNPAGVCLMDEWPEDTILRNIAMENNLSETAFIKKNGRDFDLRWFTPRMEIDLCGHATLAAAFVIYNHTDYPEDRISFSTMSGNLITTLKEGIIWMDFPSYDLQEVTDIPSELVTGIGLDPFRVFKSRDYLVILETADQVRNVKPDMNMLEKLDCLGIIITSDSGEARDFDFISRFFAPSAGVPEDPVTGSSHCSLIPYWSGQSGKKSLKAFQASSRSGVLLCEDRGQRVGIGGTAALYLKGEIIIDDFR